MKKEIDEKSETIGTWGGGGVAVICAIILFFDGRIGAGIGMLLLGTLLFALVGWIVGRIIGTKLMKLPYFIRKHDKLLEEEEEKEVAARISMRCHQEDITYDELMKKNEALLQEPYPKSDGQKDEKEKLERIHSLLIENLMMVIWIEKIIIMTEDEIRRYKAIYYLHDVENKIERRVNEYRYVAIGKMHNQIAELKRCSEKLLALPIVRESGMYDDWTKELLTISDKLKSI
ncbi:hypothetical protein FACS1894201_06810 [Bacteroidia bacterium]|nr:hypothetical protein FACS1894201_06810 [Bacteroidia bacterium]